MKSLTAFSGSLGLMQSYFFSSPHRVDLNPFFFSSSFLLLRQCLRYQGLVYWCTSSWRGEIRPRDCAAPGNVCQNMKSLSSNSPCVHVNALHRSLANSSFYCHHSIKKLNSSLVCTRFYLALLSLTKKQHLGTSYLAKSNTYNADIHWFHAKPICFSLYSAQTVGRPAYLKGE